MQSEFFTEIVSVAIEVANEKRLRKLNQNEPLKDIVHSLCTEYHLSKDSGMYALQFLENENKYVTEENRCEIKNGSILRLVLSPSECVKQIISRLSPETADAEGKHWALIKLSTLSADPVFAKAFLTSSGYKTIIDIMLDTSETAAHITYCLRSLRWLMRHRLIPPLEDKIIRRLVEFVNSEQHLPMELIECCLIILGKVIHQKEHTTGIGIPDLIQHLWNRECPTVQERALALINALAQSSDRTKILGSMVSKQTRDTIQKNILCFDISPSMAHELYVYQTLILGMMEKKLNTTIDPCGNDAKIISEINSILATADEDMQGSIASLEDAANVESLLKKNKTPRVMSKKPFYKEELVCSTPQPTRSVTMPLYMRSKSTPVSDTSISRGYKRHSELDFSEGSGSSPLISQLTLRCMLHFAQRYQKTFARVLLEEEALARPFPSTCESLVKLLCTLLGVGKPPTRDGKLYQPMVFTATSESPFIEELFCRAVLLMGRTRREMKARTLSDQEKVMRVVQRQLQEALALKPVTLEHLDDHLRRYPYSVIAEKWLSEQEEREQWKLEHLPPILQLKEEHKYSIIELIRRQRINVLLRGAKFPKYTARGQRVKKKSWFVCLSSNQRAFHYGDCDDTDKLILEDSSKISVSNIKVLVTGKKCPHIRESRNRKSDQEIADLAFSILLDEEPHSLDFVAPDHKTFDHWTDGINCLLGQPMTSATQKAELKTLLDLEVRLQLLDAEGIPIPNKPPPIPEDPPNYNFYYK